MDTQKDERMLNLEQNSIKINPFDSYQINSGLIKKCLIQQGIDAELIDDSTLYDLQCMMVASMLGAREPESDSRLLNQLNVYSEKIEHALSKLLNFLETT